MLNPSAGGVGGLRASRKQGPRELEIVGGELKEQVMVMMLKKNMEEIKTIKNSITL